MIDEIFSIFKKEECGKDLVRLYFLQVDSIMLIQYFITILIICILLSYLYTFIQISKIIQLNRQETRAYFINTNEKIKAVYDEYKDIDKKINFPHFYNDFIKKKECTELVRKIVYDTATASTNNVSNTNVSNTNVSNTNSTISDDDELVEINL